MLRSFALTAVLLTATALPAFASPKIGIKINFGGPQIVQPWIGSSSYLVPETRHFHVEYRSLRTREREFVSRHEAVDFMRFQQERGYEAHLHRGAGHMWVVHFSMPSWRLYRTVYSHHEAHDLERYLESRGFDARVVHHR